MATTLNAREQLVAAAAWLSCQHEDLSFGLKGPEDGLKLWRYWQRDPLLPEFCDEAETDLEARSLKRHRIAALSYCPFVRQHRIDAAECRRDARETATAAAPRARGSA